MTLMAANLEAMRAAAAQVDELLGMAIHIIEEGTPAERDAAINLVDSYVQLAGAHLQRFQEAARGA